jgi:putative peptidoglycan lipid II flippase
MFSMNNILARAFYALNDIKTPMKISIFCLALNLILAVWLIRYFTDARVGGEVGLGLANTFSACCNVVLLFYALRRKLSFLGLAGLRQTLLALAANAVLAGIVAALLAAIWEKRFGHHGLPLKLGAVFIPGGLASLLYGLGALWFKVPAAREISDLFFKKLRPRQP